jgi:predicted phage-related endonuclease
MVTGSELEAERRAWLEERRQGIGGSDLDDALNEKPYGCARRLAYEKTGVEPDYHHEAARLFERGQAIEPIVCDLYKRTTGRPVRRKRAARHREVKWARVNVDREILGDPRGIGVLEAKSHGGAAFRKIKRDGLPPSHILQVHWGCWVTGARWGSFAILDPLTWEFLTFDVTYDPDLIQAILPRVAQVWRQVVDGELPEKLPADDKRCQRCVFRRTCQGQELAASLKLEGEDLERDDSLTELCNDRATAKEAADEAQALVDAIDARIKQAMGERGAVEADGFRVYFREQAGRKTIDSKLLEKQYPEAYRACLTTTKPSRPLRIYSV